jgi:hypothetical protein
MIKRTVLILLLTVSVVDAKSYFASLKTFLLGNRDASAEWTDLSNQACSDFDISKCYVKWLEPRLFSRSLKSFAAGYGDWGDIMWMDPSVEYSRAERLYLVYGLMANRKANASFKEQTKIGVPCALVAALMGFTLSRAILTKKSKWLYAAALAGEGLLGGLVWACWFKWNQKITDVLAAKTLCNRNEHTAIQERVDSLKEAIRNGEKGSILRPSFQDQVDYFQSALQG